MKNKLTIQWKEIAGRSMKPTLERFYGIKTMEAAEAVLSRRVKENMLYAIWNGQWLIAPVKKIKIVKPIPEMIETPKEVIKKEKLFDKVSSTIKNLFSGKKLFSRQKH